MVQKRTLKKPDKPFEVVEDVTALPKKPLVTIRCITFNHITFIRDALDGFLLQKTDFPYEILIHDDASTDGTAEVIREYQTLHSDLIRAVFQTENQYSKGLHPWREILYKMARGKYIALCEGDDYWIDPYKLKKQVEFLEAHPECSISFHKVKRVNGENNKIIDIYPKFHGNKVFSKIDLYWKCFIQTCSVVYRNQNIADFYEKINSLSIEDWPLFVFLAQAGDIGFLDETMSVYRIHSGGINSGATRLHNITIAIEALKFFRSYERISDHPMIKKSLARYYFQTSQIYYMNKDRLAFRKILIICLRYAFSLDRRQNYQLIIMFLRLHFPLLFNLHDKMFHK